MNSKNKWIQDELMECESCGKETEFWKWVSDSVSEETFCLCYWCLYQPPVSMSYKETKKSY